MYYENLRKRENKEWQNMEMLYAKVEIKSIRVRK